MIRQRNRAIGSIQRLCKLLSTNTEAHVQAHIIVVENLIKYHKTNVVLKPSRSELRAVCASPFKQLHLHVTSHVEEEVEALTLYGTSKEVMDASATRTLMRAKTAKLV